MPIDSIVVTAIVVAIFVAFAGVLLWADMQTRPGRPSAPAEIRRRRSF